MAATKASVTKNKWAVLSFAEQMGNIGSEISRARSADGRGDIGRRNRSLDRAFELVALTLALQSRPSRQRELSILRTVLHQMRFNDTDIPLQSIEQYCLPFALVARRHS